MKHTYIYTLLASLMLLVAASSCDSYLDIKPVGKVMPTTATEFRALLTEAYDYVPDDRGLASFRSDELRIFGTSDDIEPYFDIWTWNDDASNENTATFAWRQFYHVLFIANYVIEQQNNITDGSVADISQMVGEAYMLRGYMHFVLANLFAPAYTACDPAATKAVPLKLDTDVETLLPRSTLADIYTSVLADLTDAEKHLTVDSWPAGYNYRFTTLSVPALRSRVLLYMGRWQDALAAADRVIALKGDLADLSGTSSVLPNAYNSVESIVALEKVMTVSYNKVSYIQRPFFALYESGDLRKSKYFKQLTASNIISQKSGDAANNFVCTLRAGEMYLNAAEAACRVAKASGAADDLTAAADRLLTLQKARFNASTYAKKETAVRAMDADTLLDEILTERARELALEGHRWFDLRRTTRPAIEHTWNGVTYTLAADDPRYTIPIPTAALQANPLLAE